MSRKKVTIYLIVLIVLIAGFLTYQDWKNKKNEKAPPSATASSAGNSQENSNDTSANADSANANSDQSDQNFNAECQNGVLTKVADIQGTVTTLDGKLRKVYPDDQISQDLKVFQYYVEGKTNTALSGSDLSSLDNFEDRDVEVQGVRAPDGKSVAVTAVRCAGAETDTTVIDNRDKLMNWLAANINSIAPTKAPYQKWTTDTAEFVDEQNVYVEYYDTAEDDGNANIPDNVDTSRKVLLEITANSGGSYSAKVLAYWEMGTDDYVLKSGADKFANVSDTYTYQYDPDQKSWTRI